LKITKHFVTVGQRRVHYLRAGQGPAVAMLHASPCSSKVMRPLMEIFAQKFTCFAFDTPGFGLSDPLPNDSPSVEDFADALADTLGVLGIEQVATYGRHTGASIAVEFAARHPGLCCMALADGFAVFAKAYSPKELELYLEPIVPQWDASHILRLWFRYRDQHVFWPWNKQFDANRSDTDVPDLDFLHRGVVELLQAGDGYRVGYAAPFRHRALGVVPDLKVPVCFGNRPGDSMYLTRHLYPPSVWMSDVPRDFEAASVHEMGLLALHQARSLVPEPVPCQSLPQRLHEAYVDFEGAQLAVRSSGSLSSATPVVLLHHAPGSSRLYEAAMLAIGEQYPVLAVDLPGHGESDPLPRNPQDHSTWMRAVWHVLDQLGVRSVHLWGHQGGAALACAMAVQSPERVASVTLDAPMWVDEVTQEKMLLYGIPDVSPSWEGAHWLRAWHHIRDAELWWPWFDRRETQRKPQPSQIDPMQLNLRVLEAMKRPASYAAAWRVHWSFNWFDQLPRVKAPLLCTTADSDTYAHLCLTPPGLLKAATPTQSDQHLDVLCQWWQKNA